MSCQTERASSIAASAISSWDTGPDVVFIGSLQGSDTSRVAPIKALQKAGIDVRVYGREEGWASVGIQTAGEVWAQDAAELESSAKVVLSFSRPASALWLYRSDRLLRSTAAGAAVVTYPFRGLDLMLPNGTVCVVMEGGDEEASAGNLAYSPSSSAPRAWTEEKAQRVG